MQQFSSSFAVERALIQVSDRDPARRMGKLFVDNPRARVLLGVFQHL